MKYLIGLFVTLTAYADPHTCSQYVKQDGKMNRAVEFLRRYQGRYQFGRCKVEIHVCGTYSEADDRGEMVGDVLIVDDRNREFYVPIYFLKQPSDRFWYRLQNGRILLNYKYEDRIPNPQTAGVESFHLEILSDRRNPQLARIEAGYYLRRDYVEKEHKHRYQWIICEIPPSTGRLLTP